MMGLHTKAVMLAMCMASATQAAEPVAIFNDSSAVQSDAVTEPLWELDIPRQDLDAVLMRFMRAYDGGDAARFTQLFTPMVRTEEGVRSAKSVTDEYAEVFLSTMSRRLILRNVRWSRVDQHVMAESDFMFSAFSKRDDRTRDMNGAVRFYLTKVESRWLIKELYFAYDR